jgi:putative tryptophan/tyrosine transport system substrate-binding protein
MKSSPMNRRQFVALAPSAAALAASPIRAQEAKRTPLIGVAAGFSETEMRPLLDAFRAQLQMQGWTAGSNLTIEARYAGGAYETDQARALIERKPDVIVTQGTGMLNVVRKLTTTIPVVFTMVPDPVQLGIVDNLARPGGNVTGFTNFEFSIAGKWLEIMKEIKPSLQRVLQIANPGNPNNVQFAKHIERLGATFGFAIKTAEVRTGDDITAAIDAFAGGPDGAILVLPDSLLVINRKRIIEASNRHRLPAMCPFRVFNDDGGLASYGLNFEELYRQTAGYVVRILNGEKPGELPIQAPTKFDLIINVKAAKAIGLDISPLLLARADEVIE